MHWRRRLDLRAKPATITRATSRKKLFVAHAPVQKFQGVTKMPMKYGFSLRLNFFISALSHANTRARCASSQAQPRRPPPPSHREKNYAPEAFMEALTAPARGKTRESVPTDSRNRVFAVWYSAARDTPRQGISLPSRFSKANAARILFCARTPRTVAVRRRFSSSTVH